MRLLNLLVCITVLAGCAETFNGPRVVRYSEDRFYIRYVPGLTQEQETRSIDALARTLCERVGREPEVVSSEQYLPVDVRYRKYQCVSRQTDEDADPEAKPET